ncbi:hypothetical protein FRC18_009863 [Serendipita sp. 400]|nr:hypothetical protein FRC18_009863 [Serendipita sp. 400]
MQFPLFVTLLSWLLALVGITQAVPASIVERTDSISVLSKEQVNSFSTYTLFASASYCPPLLIQNWICGPACAKLPGFKPVASGGDGGIVQYWFVGYSPSWSSVVVVYQGTDPFKLFPLLTDLTFLPLSPSQSTFPGLPSAAKVHAGFLNAFSLSQSDVFAAVKTASSKYGTKKITVIGHSMGAAIGTLAAASFKLRLGSDYTFKVVGFAQPRVGNQNWINWYNTNIPDITRINNKDDPVAVLPSLSMGYVGNLGEIHIRDDNAWINCPGNDNLSAGCTEADVGNLLTSNLIQHLGPFNGILMGLCGLS